MIDIIDKWNSVYAQTTTFAEQWYPSESVIRFIARYLQRRIGIDIYDRKREVRRILDAGCGNGRHIIFLAEQGLDVWGIDISEEAIAIANTWLVKKGLKAHLRVGDITRLPFGSERFDVVISYGVLDHVPFSEAKKIIQEIGRVTAKNGYVYITLRSTKDSEYGLGERAENNAFVLQEGYEKGIIQHFFDLEEIKELLEGFRIFDLEVHEQRFPDIFTVNKAYLQSSKGVKRYIDLADTINLDLKYARWHIAAEKVE